MKRILSISLFVILYALAGCQSAAIVDVNSAPLLAPENTNLDDVRKGIRRAGLRTGWHMVQIESGHLLAEVTVRRKHTAIVDIFFDNKTFSIKYKESENLDYDGDSIHSNYNIWIRNLKKDIQTEMQLIAVSRSPKPPSPVIEASTAPAYPRTF